MKMNTCICDKLSSKNTKSSINIDLSRRSEFEPWNTSASSGGVNFQTLTFFTLLVLDFKVHFLGCDVIFSNLRPLDVGGRLPVSSTKLDGPPHTRPCSQ